MKRWWLPLIVIFLGFLGWGLWRSFDLRSDLLTELSEAWNGRSSKSVTRPTMTSRARDVAIENLREANQLRPLTQLEQGKRIDELPTGVYGFSACDATLQRHRVSTDQLEVQKRHDRIDYYVGYASREDTAKYLSRQKNFHIRLLPYPTNHTPTLFEIPIYFVAQCTLRASDAGHYFDLFVQDIPELQS